jgi:hypothetical protein
LPTTPAGRAVLQSEVDEYRLAVDGEIHQILQPPSICLVGCQAAKVDQSPRYIIGSLVREKMPNQMVPALGVTSPQFPAYSLNASF